MKTSDKLRLALHSLPFVSISYRSISGKVQYFDIQRKYLTLSYAGNSVKSIKAEKSFVKIQNFAIYFMHLMAYLGMFRKSQRVSARTFGPKGVETSRKRDPDS